MLTQQQTASIPISNEALAAPTSNSLHTPSTNNTTAAVPASSGAVDEAEWAAFEAEMSVLDVPVPPTSAAGAVNAPGHPYADATISAPALTASQVAAKSREEEIERRKHAAEAEIADEREDATRALETEFEEMEELESRVRRLKERREELRKESVMNLRAAAVAGATLKVGMGGTDIIHTAIVGEDINEDDDEDEDDEWDGFRFRV